MRKLLLIPGFAVAFLVVAYLFFNQGGYQGGYDAPDSPDIAFEEVVYYPAAALDFTDRPIFSTNVTAATARGTLLVDSGHRNSYNREEITTLLSRVANRGYAVEFIPQPQSSQSSGLEATLEEQLRQADSFMVISPQLPYTGAEADLVADFVSQGGKLLLVADPGRRHRLNSLAEPLGVTFQPDYLYNLAEYDTNFQEIFIRDFQAHALTSNLGELVLYAAGSIESAGPGLAFTGENTVSSISEREAPRAPLAIGANRNVLAVYDLTFMIPPYNAMRDNDRLIANIADFLTESERKYRLADFPRFFGGDVDILLGNPELFDRGTQLKQLLAGLGVTAELQGGEDLSRDTVFLGLYEDAAVVGRYLNSSGVSVAETLSLSFAPDIPLEGTAVMLLYRSGDRDVLVILASESKALAGPVNALGSGKFRNGLVDDFVGVYKTE